MSFWQDVIELDLEGGAAEGEDRGRHIDELAVGKLFDESLVARLLHQLGDPVHRALEVPYLPIGSPGGTMQNLGWTVGIDVELKDRRALGAERSLIVRTARIAFDVDDLAVDGVDERAAADRAIGTDARRDLGIFDSELLGPRHNRAEIDPGADKSRQCGTPGCANRKSEKVTSGNFHGRTSNIY